MFIRKFSYFLYILQILLHHSFYTFCSYLIIKNYLIKSPPLFLWTAQDYFPLSDQFCLYAASSRASTGDPFSCTFGDKKDIGTWALCRIHTSDGAVANLSLCNFCRTEDIENFHGSCWFSFLVCWSRKNIGKAFARCFVLWVRFLWERRLWLLWFAIIFVEVLKIKYVSKNVGKRLENRWK